MHIKCVMNDDATSARSILDSPEPYMAKQIGDKVKNKDIWDWYKLDFLQNHNMILLLNIVCFCLKTQIFVIINY